METRLVRERIGEIGLDFFLSPEFIPRIKPKSLADLGSFLQARGMLRNVIEEIGKTAKHAIYGKKPIGIDYSTGHYIGSREIELFFYMQENELTKAEFMSMHQATAPKEALEAVLKSEAKNIRMRAPLGFGVDFWVDDCYGRVSELRIIPDGRVIEQPHGRAGVLMRDPVEAIKHLDNKNFYAALTNPELMNVLNKTTKLDEKFSEAKTYSGMIAKLASLPAAKEENNVEQRTDNKDKGETQKPNTSTEISSLSLEKLSDEEEHLH